MSADYTKSIEASSLRSLWRHASFVALITTTILLVAGFDLGFDLFLEEMLKPPSLEFAGLTYFLFILPWYLVILGGVALRFWSRKDEEILIPQNHRIVHFLNLIFLVPGIVIPLIFLLSILMWAFGPQLTVLEWGLILIFMAMIQFLVAQGCWKFVKDTVHSAFFPQ